MIMSKLYASALKLYAEFVIKFLKSKPKPHRGPGPSGGFRY